MADATVPKPLSVTALERINETDQEARVSYITEDWPADGFAAIASSEIVSYRREGQRLLLTGRGLFGTRPQYHAPGATVQYAHRVSGVDRG